MARKGMPKICVPLTGETVEQLAEQAAFAAAEGADMVEWRADYLPELPDAKMLRQGLEMLETHGLPVLFTYRSKAEGGHGVAEAEPVEDMLRFVASTKLAQAVDVELRLGMRLVTSVMRSAVHFGVDVVISSHNFAKTPPVDAMLATLRDMAAYAGIEPAAHIVPKLAVMPQSMKDTLALMRAASEFNEEWRGPFIAIGMGSLGTLSRIGGEAVGSVLTFAAGLSSTAPGQLPVAQLRGALQTMHDGITAGD